MHENNEELNLQYLTFMMDSRLMGLPLVSVEQIVIVQAITPVPEMPDYCKGIMNLRGSIVPVIDLRLRFGSPEIPYGEKTSIIICRVDDQLIGCIVDYVEDVLTVEEENISAVPRVGGHANAEFASGIARVETADNTKIVLLLDANKLLREGDFNTVVSAVQ